MCVPGFRTADVSWLTRTTVAHAQISVGAVNMGASLQFLSQYPGEEVRGEARTRLGVGLLSLTEGVLARLRRKFCFRRCRSWRRWGECGWFSWRGCWCR